MHNLSFSFADIVHQWEWGNEEIIVEETINDEGNKTISTIEPQETTNNGNEEEPWNKIEDETITTTETSNIFESNTSTTIEWENQTEWNNLIKKWEDQTEWDSSTKIEWITELDNSDTPTNPDTPTEPDTPTNPDTLTEPDTPTNPNTPTEPEDNTTTNETSNENWKCDRWDIEITSPMEWNTVWGIFNITWKFINDDCKDERYIIKLRESNDEYIEIYSGDGNTTWISFDSTQLLLNYYSWHKISIVQDSTEYNTIYRNEEWGDFTIDNKAPELSNTWVQYSTKNKKLNIWDTVTVSFESDEELTGVTVNIQWTRAYLDEKDWNKYKYTMEFTENNNTGKIVYWIDYSDIAWNTWYYERYDNIELDYTAPIMENINMTKSWDEIRVTFDTDEITDAYLVYMVSWAKYTNSSDSSNKTDHEFILNDIRNKLDYNYSIAIEDEAKNTLNIWWDFYLSWDDVIFTNREISKSHLITEAWFKTWDETELKEKFNSFDKCSKDLKFINMNLPINGMTWKLAMPSYTNSSVNQMTNAFTTLLVKRIEGKAFSQRDLDEIFEDLNNFLIVVKLVKDDENACKQNMSQYYINRFKKTLIKYKLINN